MKSEKERERERGWKVTVEVRVTERKVTGKGGAKLKSENGTVCVFEDHIDCVLCCVVFLFLLPAPVGSFFRGKRPKKDNRQKTRLKQQKHAKKNYFVVLYIQYLYLGGVRPNLKQQRPFPDVVDVERSQCRAPRDGVVEVHLLLPHAILHKHLKQIRM